MENNMNNQNQIDQTVPTVVPSTEVPVSVEAPIASSTEVPVSVESPKPVEVAVTSSVVPQEETPIDIPLTRERPIELEPKKEEVPVTVAPTPEPSNEAPKKSNLLFILFLFLLIGGFIYILPNANTIFANIKTTVTNLFSGEEEKPEEVIDNTILKEINGFIANSEYVAGEEVTTTINKNILNVKIGSKNYRYTLTDNKISTNIYPDTEDEMKVFMAVYDAILQHYGYDKGYADIMNVKPLEKGNNKITIEKKTDYSIYTVDVSEKINLPQYIEPETLESINIYDTNSVTIKRNTITLVKAPYRNDTTTYYIYDSKVATGSNVKDSVEVYQTIVSILKTYLEQEYYLAFIKDYLEVVDADFINFKITTNYVVTDEEQELVPDMNPVVKITILK